jgi:hypothetical protein
LIQYILERPKYEAIPYNRTISHTCRFRGLNSI